MYSWCLLHEKKQFQKLPGYRLEVPKAQVAASSSSSSTARPASRGDEETEAAGGGSKAKGDENINTLEKAAMLLDDDGRQVQARVLYSAGLPFFKAHREAMRQLKGPGSIEEHMVSLAEGQGHEALVKAFRGLSDPETLQYIGLQIVFDNKAVLKEGHPLVAHDDRLAESFRDLVGHMVAARAETLGCYRSAVPGCLATLLSPGPRQCQGLIRARCLAEALYAAEARQQTDRAVHQLLKACRWPYATLAREVLDELARVAFSCVPPAVADILRTTCRGWGHTALNENGFRVLREAERACHGQAMSGARLWMVPREEEQIARFERHEVEVDHTETLPSKRALPKAMFQSSCAKPGIDRAELQKILGPTQWPTFTRATKADGCAATELLLECAKPGNHWALARTSWMCVFFRPLSIVHNRQEGRVMLVLRRTEYAMLAWPMRDAGGDMWLPETADTSNFRWVVMRQHSDWEVLEHKATSPLSMYIDCVSKKRKMIGGLHAGFKATGARHQLLYDSALHGFPDVMDPLLRKLAEVLGKPFHKMSSEERPATTEGRVEILMRIILGAEVSAAVIANGLLCRHRVNNMVAASLVNDLRLASEGIFDSFDMKGLLKANAAQQEKRTAADRMTQYIKGSRLLGDTLPPEQKEGGKSKASDKLKTVSLAHTKLVGAKQRSVADLLPQVVGCTAQHLPQRRCWIAFYPGVQPASRTRTWGGMFTEQQCKIAVVKWAWNHHTRLTGEQCPHDFQ